MSKESEIKELLNKVMNDSPIEILLEMEREENNMSDESLQDTPEAYSVEK